MLHYHPQHRPMIADIIGHPWLAGPTATADEIKLEFARRLEIVNERVKEEQEQEKAVKTRERRGHVIKDKRYVWGELTADDKADTEYEVVRLQMNQYDPKMRKNTCFFTDVYPDTVFKTIANMFEEQEPKQDFSIHDRKWKMNYRVSRKWVPKDLEPIEGMEELGIVEESKDVAEVTETAEIQIQILDAGDSTNKDNVGWTCVEFTRKSGSSTLFYD